MLSIRSVYHDKSVHTQIHKCLYTVEKIVESKEG